MELRQSTIAKIETLPREKLEAVLAFIDSLLARPTQPTAEPSTPQGSVEDLLALAGSWKFDPGELDEILHDIEVSRLMELEEFDDVLLA